MKPRGFQIALTVSVILAFLAAWGAASAMQIHSTAPLARTSVAPAKPRYPIDHVVVIVRAI